MTGRLELSAGSADREQRLRELEDEGLYVIDWTDSPDVAYPTHSHPDREVRVVLEGALMVTVGDRSVELGPGDRMDLPPGQEHSMTVGPAGARYLAGTTRRP